MKQWVEAVLCYGWQDGYCMVDGTPIILFQNPGYHGKAYFDRKSNYSLNLQVRRTLFHTCCLLQFRQLVTLPNLCIIDYVIGHCGSAHVSSPRLIPFLIMMTRTGFEMCTCLKPKVCYFLTFYVLYSNKKQCSFFSPKIFDILMTLNSSFFCLLIVRIFNRKVRKL